MISFPWVVFAAIDIGSNAIRLLLSGVFEADIRVDIIDGKIEAQVIFENKSADMFGGSEAYLYVDIGGGSTEITLFSQGRIITSG